MAIASGSTDDVFRQLKQLDEYKQGLLDQLNMTVAPPMIMRQQHDPFSTLPEYEHMSRLGDPMGKHAAHSVMDDIGVHTDHVIRTMEAFKDVLAWVKAQETMINTSYPNEEDSLRRNLHLAVLRNGISSLLYKEQK